MARYLIERAGLIARQAGLRGQVASAPTARYYRPGAMLREFAAMFLSHKLINFGVCTMMIAGPVAYAARHVI